MRISLVVGVLMQDPMQLEMFRNNSDSDRLKQMALSLFQYHWFTGCGVLHGMLMQDRMLFHLLIWVCSILSGNLSKLAGETYQQTDANFLDSERETFRDDGSTASTAVLVGNHLYVANVGDSRAIISKAGKGHTHIMYYISFVGGNCLDISF